MVFPRAAALRALAVLALAGILEPLAAQEYRAVVRLQPRTAPVVLDTLVVVSQLDAPPGRVFTAVRQGFAVLGIPARIQDSSRGIVGNDQLVRRGTLAKQPLSHFFNCGSTMMGPNADRDRVTIAVAALIDSLPDGRTRLGLATTAMARDLEGASLDPVGCETTGLLESRLATAIKAALLRAGSG